MQFFYTLILLLAFTSVFSQTKQNLYYLKDSGELVDVKDSADYIRVMSEADPVSKLYNVRDFYLNEKVKLTGKSSAEFPGALDGYCISYFPNGSRKAVYHYTNGVQTGLQQFYYPNGKFYKELQYPEKNEPGFDFENNPHKLIIALDSTGKQMITGGDGYYKGYDDKFAYIAEEGPVKNGKRDGDWKGKDDKLHLIFKETCSNGILQKGTLTDRSGQITDYVTARNTRPQFKGGNVGLSKFLSQTLQYPEKATKANIQGRVTLGFTVEIDGQITGIILMQSAGKELDEEAVRVAKLFPAWIPATNYGRPVRMFHTFPLVFSISDR